VDEIPSTTELFQNYPNPFNPQTVIRYRLSVNSFVALKIFDVLGREVTELVNQSTEAGEHSIVWNAGENPSGVYVARLEIMPNSGGIQAKSIQIKKLLLMR